MEGIDDRPRQAVAAGRYPAVIQRRDVHIGLRPVRAARLLG
ncbi:MAG: hypothetical protein M5U05_18475 [Anaerolineales bacterium]|nr:hypothetical protein [Anaerolineales bacterium]